MMKSCLRIFTLFGALFCGTVLNAHINPASGCFFVEGDYLFQKPSVDNTYFVIKSASSTSSPIGERINNDFGFHSGFRIGGGYAFCNCNRSIEAYYTRLCNHSKKFVQGDFLWATNGIANSAFTNFDNYSGTAESRLSLYYQKVESYINQQLFCCEAAEVDLIAGFEYFNGRFKESDEYISQSEGTLVWDTVQRSRAWGIGPEFGFAFNYLIDDFRCICPGTLRFTSYGTGSILASKTVNGATYYSDSVVISSISDRDTWRLIPALHARFGLNYTLCLAPGELSLELGYEFNCYFRAFSKSFYTSASGQGLSPADFHNLGLQGLYVQVGFYF